MGLWCLILGKERQKFSQTLCPGAAENTGLLVTQTCEHSTKYTEEYVWERWKCQFLMLLFRVDLPVKVKMVLLCKWQFMLSASRGSVAVPKASGTFAVFWLRQCQTNGTGGFGCSAQSRSLCAGTNCALQTVSLPGRGVLNIWYLVFFGAFSVSGTTECLLTLSFLCLSSMHGPLRLLALGTPNFAPEWAATVTFLFFQDNGSHLILEKVLGLFLSASFSLTEKGPQDWYFSSSNIGAIMKTALHVSVAKLALHED